MASDRKRTDNQIQHLRALQDREPDTQDIPEAPAENWRHAQRGAFWKPRKEAISLRVYMDVLDWLRQQGPGYRTTIDRIVRERMQSEHR